MGDVMMGFGVLVIVFFLVIFLGIQIQISILTQRIDDLVSKLEK